jgi:hypothetical protein
LTINGKIGELLKMTRESLNMLYEHERVPFSQFRNDRKMQDVVEREFERVISRSIKKAEMIRLSQSSPIEQGRENLTERALRLLHSIDKRAKVERLLSAVVLGCASNRYPTVAGYVVLRGKE